MKTFNVKIVIFLIVLIISLISISTVFIFDLATFKGREYVFIPMIIAMTFTLIRFYNNLMEKSKIVEDMRKMKEDALIQTNIQFNTCPEYWTKTSANDKVLCRNVFVDKDDEKMVIGGKLTTLSGTVDSTLSQTDTTSNIGFAQFKTTTKAGDNTFNNPDYSYIPNLRSNLVAPVVEGFTASDEDTVPHMHKRTEILYTPTTGNIKWADGVERSHDLSKFKDSKHLEMYEYSYVHDHTSGNSYDLDFKKYNMNTDSFDVLQATLNGENAQVNNSRVMYSNDTNWISPFQQNGELYAEINLNELNKASNKCELVKNLPWVEAKAKCENVGVQFDA